MEVIIEDCRSHPSCPHGPCLLFERYSSNGSKTGRKFYACSACRDRKVCSFFQWADDEMSEHRKSYWAELIEKEKPPYLHEEFVERLLKFKQLPQENRIYCKTCSLLVLDDLKDHNHSTNNISLKDLVQPLSLFEVLKNKKAEAQYFFSDATTEFLVSLLKDLGYNKLLLLGTPKIAEYLLKHEIDEMLFFLMDIDYRYMQFFRPEQFSHYNMFNNHFFSGKNSKKQLVQFLYENENEKVAVILDPPFGGLIDAVSFSLKRMNSLWQKQNSKSTGMFPILWFFPYFLEDRIRTNFPDMKMMDYKVNYCNHAKFGSKVNSKGSPVRIITNIKASNFILPSEEGYRFCIDCQRFVSPENQHCFECKDCTTKFGKTYHHCEECKKCVKSSHIHCKTCNICGPVSSNDPTVCKNCKCSQPKDGKNFEKCFRCSGIGHRKGNCPEGVMRHMKKRQKRHL